MAKLTPFWQLLENRNDKTAVLAEWKQRVGDSFGVVNPLLTPTGGYASAYPHPKPYGLMLRVIRHKNGDIVAICPEDGDIRVPLTKTDIALYHVNMEKVRKTLARALSLVPSQDTIRTSDQILLGKYKPKPSAEFSVYMIVAKPQTFFSIIKDLCQTTKHFIVLTTSMKDCPEEAYGLIEKKSSMMVLLDDVLEYSDAGIQCTDQWQQCLSIFAQKVNPKGARNFSNTTSLEKTRARRAIAGDLLQNALHKHLIAARDHAHTTGQYGPAKLLPRPQEKELAKMLKLSKSAVSRAINDLKLTKLKILWDCCLDIDAVMKYK